MLMMRITMCHVFSFVFWIDDCTTKWSVCAGRKQQQQRRGAGTRVDEYTDDDTLSTTTTSSSLDALSDISITPEVEEEHDDATKLESFIEALYQKR